MPVVDDAADKRTLISLIDTSVRKPRSPIDVIIMSRRGLDLCDDLLKRALERAREHLTKTIYSHLAYASDLTVFVESDDFRDLLNWELLDDYFGALVDAEKWILDVTRLAAKALEQNTDSLIAGVQTELFNQTLQKINERKNLVIDFCRSDPSDKDPKFIGDENARRDPQLIFVLGGQDANQQNARLEYAKGRLQELQRAAGTDFEKLPHVVVCGGMQCGGQTEASVMHSQLTKDVAEWPPERLHREEFSLDTVGNAVLGALLVERKQLNINAPGTSLRVLVATSDFHAPRALSIFRRVLSRGSQIAVSMIPSKCVQNDALESGLTSERLANRESLSVANYITGEPEPIEPGQPAAVLLQMCLRHRLYQGRPDLLKFAVKDAHRENVASVEERGTQPNSA